MRKDKLTVRLSLNHARGMLSINVTPIGADENHNCKEQA
jgi:hypothetical protein